MQYHDVDDADDVDDDGDVCMCLWVDSLQSMTTKPSQQSYTARIKPRSQQSLGEPVNMQYIIRR